MNCYYCWIVVDIIVVVLAVIITDIISIHNNTVHNTNSDRGVEDTF